MRTPPPPLHVGLDPPLTVGYCNAIVRPKQSSLFLKRKKNAYLLFSHVASKLLCVIHLLWIWFERNQCHIMQPPLTAADSFDVECCVFAEEIFIALLPGHLHLNFTGFVGALLATRQWALILRKLMAWTKKGKGCFRLLERAHWTKDVIICPLLTPCKTLDVRSRKDSVHYTDAYKSSYYSWVYLLVYI